MNCCVRLRSAAQRERIAFLTVMLWAIGSWPAGRVEAADFLRLGGTASSAGAAFQAPQEEQVDAARAAALLQAREVVLKLSQAGADGRFWEQKLQVAALAEALERKGAPLEQLKEIHGRFYDDVKGIEWQRFLKLRQTLDEYLKLRATFENRDLLADELPLRLEIIQQLLEGPSWDAPRQEKLSRQVRWLEQHGQKSELASRLHQSHSYPNTLIDISSEALGVITLDPVLDVKPINDNSGEVPVRGQAVVTGQARLAPVRGTTTGECRVVFEGHMSSTLNGGKGPVAFQLGGSTSIRAEKRVVLSVDQFLFFPAQVDTCTNLRTNQICSKPQGLIGKLVRGIARRRIEKERPESSAKMSRKAAREMGEELDKEVEKELREGESELRNELLAPLERRAIRPERFDFLTNNERLQISLLMEARQGLGAAGVPPAIELPFDIGVRVNESTVNRLASALLAGETLTADELAKQMAELAPKSVSEAAKKPAAPPAPIPSARSAGDATAAGKAATPESSEEEFTITFVDDAPVSVEFRNDQVLVTLRGRQFTVGTIRLAPMNVTLVYDIVTTGGDVELVWNEKAVIEPPERGLIDPRKAAGLKFEFEDDPQFTPPANNKNWKFLGQKSVLERRLVKEIRRQNLDRQKIVPPSKLPEPANKLGQLEFSRFTTDRGWLIAVLKRAAPQRVSIVGP